MALTNYYTVLQQQSDEPGQWHFTIRLNPDCEVYKGHFPDQPVAPGVCQLLVVKECAEKALGKPLRITRIKQCKFVRIIIPTEVNTLEVLLSIGEDYGLVAEVRDAENSYVKIKAQLEQIQ